jgi:hypothetical protein
VTSEELREQVGRISAGDFVVARFKPEGSTEYTVSGVVHAGWAGGLYIGRNYVLCRAGVPQSDLVAIESHEPAKPPVPPEPQGDYLLREPSGQVSVPAAYQPGVLMRQDDGARLYWDTLVYYHGDDLKIYRPAPSPERIEELVLLFADRLSCSHWPTDYMSDEFREFATALLGGEQ